jgi:hypothetical protein
MCDWFTFEVGRDEVIIHVNMQILLETQPVDTQDADDFCNSVMFPVIDQLRQVCIEKGYSQRCVVNLEGANVKLMNPVVLVRIINNIYNHAKDTPENLIKAVEIQNANSLFRALYYASSYFLPTYMVNLLTMS